MTEIHKKYIEWRGELKMNQWFIPLVPFLIPYIILIILPGRSEGEIFDVLVSLILFDNPFLASLNAFVVVYVYFTLINLILQKFNFSWLTSKGWKLGIDFTILFSMSFLLGAIFESLGIESNLFFWIVWLPLGILWGWKFSN